MVENGTDDNTDDNTDDPHINLPEAYVYKFILRGWNEYIEFPVTRTRTAQWQVFGFDSRPFLLCNKLDLNWTCSGYGLPESHGT